jgi:hypothetical protein
MRLALFIIHFNINTKHEQLQDFFNECLECPPLFWEQRETMSLEWFDETIITPSI